MICGKRNMSASSTNRTRRMSYAIIESFCLFGVSGGPGGEGGKEGG